MGRTGVPFSQIKHTVDSVQGDSIEWANSGYTKLVNTGGGQWTADFLNFKVNSDMQMQIYPDSDGYHTKIMSDFVQMTGNLSVGGKLTATALTLTPATNVTINNNSSYQFGNMVVINVRVTLSATINANSTILSGLPNPISSLGSSSIVVACSSSRPSNAFAITGGGQLVASDANATAQMYVISATYFTS